MLNVSHLNVYYGDSHVLRDLSLELAPSESLAIMGRNGMGKTTLLRSLVGMLPLR
ncbi:ATP-binding cassette domain-containing protein, partial [Pseudomonas tremae]|uniref:ATP-binding cassette domain-containing protein n=1 Tax=Pseudomonas tremae TaxID=200454 RepID=UPI000A424968